MCPLFSSLVPVRVFFCSYGGGSVTPRSGPDAVDCFDAIGMLLRWFLAF